MQESGYSVSAINRLSNDYGIGQINHQTMKRFKLDKDRLLNDLDYSISASAMILADFKRMYGKRESQYWTRYNSGTPSKRETYKKLVSRFM